MNYKEMKQKEKHQSDTIIVVCARNNSVCAEIMPRWENVNTFKIYFGNKTLRVLLLD